jgi:hypothetical protein
MKCHARHEIFRVVEVLPEGITYTDMMRRILQFKRAGVVEYWAVDLEGKDVYPFRLCGFDSVEEQKIPSDWNVISAGLVGAPSSPPVRGELDQV